MDVVFVASNPSHLGPDSPAKKNFYKWVGALGADIYTFHNVSNRVTPGNRPLKRSEYELDRLRNELGNATKIVALGNTASDALNKLGVKHFKLPHPSPRNRLLNDAQLIDDLLILCKKYLET